MMKFSLCILGMCGLFLVVFSNIGISGSRRTVMVFYPSPYGEYIDLRSKYIAVGGNLMDASLYNSQDGEIHIQSKAVFGDPNDSSHRGFIAYDPFGEFKIETETDGLDLVINSGAKGDVTINKDMTITIGESADISVGSDLSVNTNGEIDVTGNNAIKLTSNGTTVTISSTGVEINSRVIISSGGVDITGGANIRDGINVTGGANISGGMGVNGGANISGNVSINGDVTVNGRLRVCT